MSPARCEQAGFTLLENLIAMLLLMLIGLGLAFVTTRSLINHQQLQRDSQLLAAIRGQLQGYAPCNPAALTLDHGHSQGGLHRCETLNVLVSPPGGGGVAIPLRLQTLTVVGSDGASSHRLSTHAP